MGNLTFMVIVSNDDRYADQEDNYSIDEIIVCFILGFSLIIFSLTTVVTHIRFYCVAEEEKNLTYLMQSFNGYKSKDNLDLKNRS